MDSSDHSKIDSSILLLNEIEILLAQSRLLELYAKQAQAAAAYETARLHEQHQAELAALRSALADQEQIVAARQIAVGAAEQNLREQVQIREHELAESRHRSLQREAELQRAEFEAASLLERIGRLESSIEQAQDQARQSAAVRAGLESELSVLRKRLEDSQQVFHGEQLIWREIESDVKNQLAQRDERLRETITRLHAAESELQEARREIAQLHERIAKLQASGQEADAKAIRELERASANFAADLGQLQAALAEREQALEEKQSASIEIERTLKTEILTLRSQLDQQQELIGFRDDELRDVQSHFAALQQRAAELEAANQTALADAEEIGRLRRHYENQLAALQHEVTIRERALTERQEAVTAVELALHGKIQSLRQELARGRNLTEQRDSELQKLRAESDALRERVGEYETSASAQQAAGQLAEETRSRLEAEITNLQAQNAASEHARGELEQARIRTDEEIAQLRAANASIADATKNQLGAKITQLQLQLAEKQLVVDSRATEIHDLKAEIDRLMNQLAQGDFTTAELKHGWQREIDRNRAEHQVQLAALGAEFQLKQQNLENSLAEERQRIADYQQQVDSFGQRSANLETELEKRHRELETASAETMDLRWRLEELEKQRQTDLAATAQESEQARLALDAELAEARHELQEKARAAAQQQATLENLTLAHRNEIQTLEARISQEQQSVKDREVELEGLRSQARLLERRIEEAAEERQQAELTAVNRAARIKEEYTGRIADLDKQLAQKASEMLERSAAQSDHESALHREIDRLIHESSEKNQILQNRNEELVRVKADRDMLQEQYRALESAATQNEAAISADSERMRTEFQAQLALLQAELSQKEWAIEERQALLHGLEQNYRQEIDSLSQRLAELEKNGAEEKHDFVLGDPVPSQDKLEGTKANGDEPFASNQQRRWHTGFGWKRRWKTSETQ